MKQFILVKVPIDAIDIFINNVGCLRYTHNEQTKLHGRISSVVEPVEMGVFLENSKHKIVGESFLNKFTQERYIVIEIID